jgi:hypothetical protein
MFVVSGRGLVIDHILSGFDYYSALLLPFMKAVSQAIKTKRLKSSSG